MNRSWPVPELRCLAKVPATHVADVLLEISPWDELPLLVAVCPGNGCPERTAYELGGRLVEVRPMTRDDAEEITGYVFSEVPA